MAMQPNIGKLDTIIRYIVGLALLSLIVLLEGPWRWAGLAGIILIATASINWCPVWRVFGINTRGGGQG